LAETGLIVNSLYWHYKFKRAADPLEREFYRNNRNLSNWWLVGTILYSLLDAYVDAHLSTFDESPSLALRVGWLEERIGLDLEVHF